MAKINWNAKAFRDACIGATMDQLEAAAKVIVEDAKRILQSKIKGPPVKHGPYKKGKYRGAIWTERDPGAMVETIRWVRKHGDPNKDIWIMAGNYKTWWALQMEYGRGDWKGGKKSFIRPAMQKAPKIIQEFLGKGRSQLRVSLEGGSGQTKSFKENVKL